jgi:hypothetical protein
MHFHTHTSTMIKQKNMTTANAALRLLVTLVAISHVAAAHASLGGDSASVETDRLHMKVKHAARLTTSSTGSYTVHETTLPTGTLVRQYVSSAGVVFAVTWSGPFMPNLRQLLGPHFDTMVARQAKRNHVIRRSVRQHESDLVIESGGHPRSFVGRAYLPSALPAGVAEKDIQ